MALELARKQDAAPLITSAGQRTALSPDTNDRIYYLPSRQFQRWDGSGWVGDSPSVDGSAVLDKGGAVYNVKHPDFGAKGDGVTDDKAAIQSAIDLGRTDGVPVLIPPGSYRLATGLTFGTQDGESLIIEAGVTILVPSGVTALTVGIASGSTTARNLSIRCYGRFEAETSGQGTGLLIRRVSRSLFLLGELYDLVVGIDLGVLLISNTFDFRWVRDCVTGIRGRGSSTQQINANRFRGEVQGGITGGDLQYAVGNDILCTIEDTTGDGLILDTGCSHNTFRGWMESNTNSDLIVRNSLAGTAPQLNCVLPPARFPTSKTSPQANIKLEDDADLTFVWNPLVGGGNVLEIESGVTNTSVCAPISSSNITTAAATHELFLLNTFGPFRFEGYVEGVETTDPAAPPANMGRLYFRDNGGKTELVVRFPTGAIQQVAIEP
jgi:hypothetical protein